jgi:hypothetical protein
MASKSGGYGSKWGISSRTLAATATDEAPGPGAERKTQVGSRLAAGAGTPKGAALPRGRAFEDFEGGAFETLILESAARILARQHGNAVTLRPVQVLEEAGVKVYPVHYSVVADILLHHPEMGEWKLARAEKREGKLVYLHYIRTRVKCPVCGKLLRRRSAASHARSHIEKLERMGVIKLERADGRWLIALHDGRKIYGASWLALLRLAEMGVVTNG